MSRTPIGGIIAALILVFTVVAYYVTTTSLTSDLRSDVEHRVERAQRQLTQSALLEGLSIKKQVEKSVAHEEAFARALAASTDAERRQLAQLAFRAFIQDFGEGDVKPDFLWLLDEQGRVAAQHEIANPVASEFLDGDEIIYPAIRLALDNSRMNISDVWLHEKHGLMRVGVAPVTALTSKDTTGAEVKDPAKAEGERNSVGVLVIGYPMTAREAQVQQGILGAHVAYFHGDRIFATSFMRNAGEEDTVMQGELSEVLAKDGLGEQTLAAGRAPAIMSTSISGDEFLVTAVRMPRFSSQTLPSDYPASTTGAVITMSVDEAMSPLRMVRWTIILLGVAAFILALLASTVTAKRILHQADEIEDGINDIIDGNLDRSIRPVGADLDGLAHAVNVMLARLMGRPEPGDEAYDQDGNLVQASRVDFDNEELANLAPADERSMKLAHEDEPEYYSRVFREYVDARQATGESTDSVTYENFVAKLRLNEAKLKSKYQCSAVRFRVVVKDGKVSLKPVPIV